MMWIFRKAECVNEEKKVRKYEGSASGGKIYCGIKSNLNEK